MQRRHALQFRAVAQIFLCFALAFASGCAGTSANLGLTTNQGPRVSDPLDP
ncbi:MAG: hypothetical protein M3Z22_03555 [Verrucomicrobiota bacterium]|nr:hypothetical protein [Verrucomicrobiota bacterium]